MRLFKRQGVTYSSDIVHEKVVLPAHFRIGQCKLAIEHHSFQDVSHMLYKLNRYSSYSAQIQLEKQKNRAFTTTCLGTIWMFIRCYFLQGGFLDGKAGVLFAFFQAQGTFYRGIKQLYPDVQLELDK